MNEMRVLLVTSAAAIVFSTIRTDSSHTSRNGLTLIHTRLLHNVLARATEVCRLCKLLTLIELVKMRGVFVDGLRAFLVLAGVVPHAHVRSGDGVTP